MPEIKKDCFGFILEDRYNGCFCLNELYCKKENCRFYKEKKQAKKEYLEHYTVTTASLIARSVDRHFRDL